jgi:type I restriction enzyme S subunit
MVETLKYATVKFDEVIANNCRLEASVFNIEARNAKEILKHCKWELKTVCGNNGIASSYVLERFKRIFVEKSEFPIYQPSQILELRSEKPKYISSKTNTNIDALRVHKGQILMTCSGTTGKTAIVSNQFDNKIFSHDLLRITTHNSEDTGFLYAFFNSEVGRKVVLVNNYGAVIQHIEPEHLQKVEIPNPENEIKEKIHNLIMESFDLRDKSNELIDEAEKLLLENLKLPPLDKLKPGYFDNNANVKTFLMKLEDLNNRLDGSYHLPLIYALENWLLNNSECVKRIGDTEISQKIIQAGRFKRNYVDSNYGIVFLGGKQLLELDPSTKKYLSRKIHSERFASELFLKENMIAVTCSGTIGKVNIVPKHWENWAMSQHVLRIIVNDEIAGYLYIWLQSEYGQCLIERQTYGSVVNEIEEEHLADVPVPLLKDKNTMQKINDLALTANKLRAEAYYKEQEAIKMIDEEVIYAK